MTTAAQRNFREAIKYKLSQIAEVDGNKILLMKVVPRFGPLYEGLMGGNEYFYTDASINEKDLIDYEGSTYIVRNVTPAPNGFDRLEVQRHG